MAVVQYTFTHKPYNNTTNNRTTQITTKLEECRPCPVFASFTLAFVLQLRKKHRKTLSQGSRRGKKCIHCTYFLTENNAKDVSLFSDSIMILTSFGQQLQQLTRYKARSLFTSTQLLSYEDTQRTCGSEVSSPHSQKLLTGSYHGPVQSRPQFALFPL